MNVPRKRRLPYKPIRVMRLNMDTTRAVEMLRELQRTYATGGIITAGEARKVGEKGPEMWTPPPGTKIVRPRREP